MGRGSNPDALLTIFSQLEFWLKAFCDKFGENRWRCEVVNRMAITAKTVLVFWTLLHHLCCSALPKLAYKDYSDKVAWGTRGDGYDYDYDYSDYNYHQQDEEVTSCIQCESLPGRENAAYCWHSQRYPMRPECGEWVFCTRVSVHKRR